MLRPFAHPVVESCCAKFETGQTFQPTTPNISFVLWSPKRSATMLDPFARFFQHCRGHARWLRMDYRDLWVVFFPRCTAGPKLVGSWCIRLHTTANPHARTPNIVSATMLGVVVSVCTQPYQHSSASLKTGSPALLTIRDFSIMETSSTSAIPSSHRGLVPSSLPSSLTVSAFLYSDAKHEA